MDREHLAKAVVGIRPGPRYIGSNGRIGDRPGEQVAESVVSKGSCSSSFRNQRGQPENGAPRRGYFQLRRTRRRSVRCWIRGAGAAGRKTFNSHQLETTSQVVRVASQISIVVGTARRPASGIVARGKPVDAPQTMRATDSNYRLLVSRSSE